MPLSEDEQRILQEIEAQFYANDPHLAQQVSETTLYRHSARNIKWAALGFVVGFVVLPGLRRVPGHAGLRLGDRRPPAQDGQGRPREHHRLGQRQEAQELLRRRRQELPPPLPQRRERQLSARTARPHVAEARGRSVSGFNRRRQRPRSESPESRAFVRRSTSTQASVTSSSDGSPGEYDALVNSRASRFIGPPTSAAMARTPPPANSIGVAVASGAAPASRSRSRASDQAP